MTPTSRSLAYLRKNGYTAAVVERYNSFRKFKTDLFGFIDIVAIRDGETVGVQSTSGPNVSSRIAKIRAHENLQRVLGAGWAVEVHGWQKPTKTRRTWQVRVERVHG